MAVPQKTAENEKPTCRISGTWASKLKLQKELRFESTSGQMSAADSSRLPRYNNRSGKSCACSKRLRGVEGDVNASSARKIGCGGLGIWIHGVGGESES